MEKIETSLSQFASERKQIELIKDNRLFEKHANIYDSLSDSEPQEDDEKNKTSILIDNSSSWYKAWEITISVCIIFSLFVEPYRNAFYKKSTLSWIIMSLIIDFCFMADLLLNFFKPIKIENKLIVNNYDIAKNYLLGYFTVDLISAFPMELFEFVDFESDSDQVSGFLNIGRIYRIAKLLKVIRFKRLLNLRSSSYILNDLDVLRIIEIKRMIGILAGFLVLIHFSSCVFIFLGKSMLNEGATWLTVYGLVDESNYVIYITSIYFSLTTILSVGYGDILSITMPEKVFNIFFSLISCIFFSYTLSSISKIFHQMDEKSLILRNKLEIFSQLCKENLIPKDLQSKIKETLKHSVKHSHLKIYTLIQELPKSLKSRIVYCMHRHYMNSMNFTKERSHEFISMALPLLKRPLFKYKEVLLKVGEFFEEIVLVVNAKISITMGVMYDNFEVARLSENEHFGDVLMYLNQQSPYSLYVKSKESNILTLSKIDYFNLVSLYGSEIKKILEESIKFVEKLEDRRKIVVDLHDFAENKEHLRRSIEILSLLLFEYDFYNDDNEDPVEISKLLNNFKKNKYKEVIDFLTNKENTDLNAFFSYLEAYGKQLTNIKKANKQITKSPTVAYEILAKRILDFSLRNSNMDYLNNTGELPQGDHIIDSKWTNSKIPLEALKTKLENNSEMKENKSKLKDFIKQSRSEKKEKITHIEKKLFGTETPVQFRNFQKKEEINDSNACLKQIEVDDKVSELWDDGKEEDYLGPRKSKTSSIIRNKSSLLGSDISNSQDVITPMKKMKSILK